MPIGWSVVLVPAENLTQQRCSRIQRGSLEFRIPVTTFLEGSTVRPQAFVVAVILSLMTLHAFAEDSIQPLTRADCARNGFKWDENTNVCGTHSKATDNQPLTRSDCTATNSSWNENANVCEWGASLPIAESSEGMLSDTATILVSIDKSKQRMTVFVDGVQRYYWPVSTGAPGYSTPSGTYAASSMNEIWYSKEWDNAPMPHAVFFTKVGHAIHGTNETRRLGKPASHGCVRLAPQNAATLYRLVEENGLANTQVVLVGHTPGGEGKAPPQRKPRGVVRSTPRYEAGLSFEPRRRGGLFGRRWWRR
jgi:hypothetical protein